MTPLLPLYTWLEMMQFDPFHSFGIAGTGDLRADSGCDTLLRRYAWQNTDAAGLLEIERAIEQAETKLANYLGYSPAPHYVTETVAWPQMPDGTIRTGPWGSDGRWLGVQLGEGYLRAIGVETRTAILANAAVTYSDVDGDTFTDTFTLGPIATTVTDPNEIAVYFSAADRFSGFGSTSTLGERWRVQPIQVTISGGFVTIRGPRQVCVKPIKYEGRTNIGANGLEPGTAANFVTTLDVYRRYAETEGATVATAQGVITWETRPYHGWWCCCANCCSDCLSGYNGSPYDPVAVAQAVSRVGIRDSRAGIVMPAEATLDTTTSTWASLDWTACDQPDRVTIRYLAGYPLDSDGLMAEPYRTIVARMAAAELAKPLCGCERANNELAYWQFDRSRTAGANDEQYAITQEDLANPFGTRRGHIYAWKNVNRMQQTYGLLG